MTAPLRVCFLGSARYQRPLDATNARKFQVLAPLGDLLVIGFSGDLLPRRFREHARFYLLPALPGTVLRRALLGGVGFVLALWTVVRHGVAVLVAQSPVEGFPAACAQVTARWLGRRCALVVESHGDFEEGLFLYRRVPLPAVSRSLIRGMARFVFRHADVLRGISAATEEQLRRWAPGRPVVRFPAWTEIDVFLDTPDRPRSPEVLFAGVLVPLKGVEVLVRAFASVARDHPQARLRIVGREANRAYARALRAEVRRLGLEDRVSFAAAVPQRTLADLMSRASALVLPSLSEGLGRVALEALACGTPVIGSRVGGIPDLVADGVTGFLVPPGGNAALAEKIGWILAHPPEAREMGRRGRAAARTFFSVEGYVRGYRDLFALAQEAGRRPDAARRRGDRPAAT